MAPFSSSTLVALESNYSDDVFHFHPLKMELEAAFLNPIMFSGPQVLPQTTATVHFETVHVTINPEPEFYTDEDVAIKWFNNDDFARIKLQAKDLCSELRRSDSPQDTTLTIAHRKTSLMLKSDFKALVKLTPTTPDQDLTKWCSYTDGRRGLERFASRDYSIMRRNDISNTLQAVLNGAKLHHDAETIAHSAREASRRARTFARFFAAADADVSKNAEESLQRRAPTRCVSMQAGLSGTGFAPTADRPNMLIRRLPSRLPTKAGLPPSSTTSAVAASARSAPLRSKSMRPSELVAPMQRCAPARKRSKQVHGSTDFCAMAR